MKNGRNRIVWSYLPVTFIAALFCCVLWGSASPAIKIAYEIFDIPPEDTASRIMLAGARFLLAGVMTILFGSIVSRRFLRPKRSSLKYMGRKIRRIFRVEEMGLTETLFQRWQDADPGKSGYSEGWIWCVETGYIVPASYMNISTSKKVKPLPADSSIKFKGMYGGTFAVPRKHFDFVVAYVSARI